MGCLIRRTTAPDLDQGACKCVAGSADSARLSANTTLYAPAAMSSDASNAITDQLGLFCR